MTRSTSDARGGQGCSTAIAHDEIYRRQILFHTIEIVNDQMCIMDEDGNGHAAALLTGYRLAKGQIQKWMAKYTIDVAVAYRQLADHFLNR